MPCSGQGHDTPSRICVSLTPLNVLSTGIVDSASGELDFVPSYQDDELAYNAKDKERLIQLHNTSSGSPSSHSSSIVSLSSATSSFSALCTESSDDNLGAADPLQTSIPVLRPTRTTFTIGPLEEDNEISDEGSSVSASRGMIVEGKGKNPEGIKEIPILPRSRPTTAARWSKSASNAIGERKYPNDNQTSVSHEIEDPSTYFLSSSLTSCESEDEDFAELSASVATIRPARIVAGGPDSSASSVIDDLSEPVSRATSPHSDQGYTWEVRPPSSIMAARDGEEQDNYHSPTLSQINTPESAGTHSPTSSSGLHVSRPNSRRPAMMRPAPTPELPPVPPVASIRVRRPWPSSQDGPQFSGSRSSEYPRAHPPSQSHRALRSSHSQRLEQDTINVQVTQRSTSTARSPSLSPLAWEIAQEPTSSTSVLDTPSNPLLSSPSSFQPVPTPNPRGDESHTYSQPGRMPLSAGVEGMSFPDSLASVPVTGPSNPPLVPQRTRRFTAPLPPSPGSSLRMSAFNSPFAPGVPSVDSWGTPATMPGESIYNHIPGEAAQWADLPQPPLSARNSTPSWLPEANANGYDPLWTNVGWSDPTQIPQGPPISTANPSPPYITPPGYLICRLCGSPPAACVCGRFVRVAPVSTGATSAGLRPPTRAHPTFWFHDGTVTFEVEDVFFKVHKYFFEHHSEDFSNLLARRLGALPVRIPDAKKLDFERLLRVFYPSNLADPDLATVEEWTSVLTLAVRWHMDELICLAIQKLTPITSAVDKISLAKKFGLFGYNLAPNSNYNRDWLLPALRELCGRNFPLRFEEARKLDMWTVVKVWEVQHEICNAGLIHNGSQIERLIKRRFGLE